MQCRHASGWFHQLLCTENQYQKENNDLLELRGKRVELIDIPHFSNYLSTLDLNELRWSSG